MEYSNYTCLLVKDSNSPQLHSRLQWHFFSVSHRESNYLSIRITTSENLGRQQMESLHVTDRPVYVIVQLN